MKIQMMLIPLLLLANGLCVTAGASLYLNSSAPNNETNVSSSSRIMQSSSKEYDLDACINAERTIYNGTPLQSSEFINFFQSSVWKDSSFDLVAFFNSLSFKGECQRRGGEVVKLDIEIDCPSSPYAYLENFKFCAPVHCNEFEYSLLKSYIISTVGETVGCSMEGTSKNVPSTDCLSALENNYNGTDIESYSAVTFISTGGGGSLEVRVGRMVMND